MSHTGF